MVRTDHVLLQTTSAWPLTLIISNVKDGTMDRSRRFHIYTRLHETELRFKKACEQVVLLNDKLMGLQVRYDRARQENSRSFRYNLRLRMATVEGVRNAYYEYACEQAERIAEVRYEVSRLDTDSSSEESDSLPMES